MTDLLPYGLGAVAVAGIIFLAILVDRMQAWHILKEWMGMKTKPNKELGQKAPPKECHITFKDAKKGVFYYYGQNPKPDGQFDVLDMDARPVLTVDPRKLRLTEGTIKSILAGRTRHFDFIIEDESAYAELDKQIGFYKLKCEQLTDQLKSAAMADGELQGAHAKVRRKIYDVEFKGRKVFYDPKNKGGGHQQQMEAPPDGGGE